MFLLNLQSKEPIYEQIQKQLIRFIQSEYGCQGIQ